MAKRNAIVGTTIEGGVLTLTVLGFAPIVIASETLHPNIQLGAMMRGLKQRVENAAAIERDRETGKPSTPEEKYNAIKAIAEHVMTGDTWEVPRVRGVGRKFNIGAVAAGMVRAFRIGVDEATARIEGLAAKRGITQETAARVWLATPEVTLAVAAIAAETAPTGGDALLAELEGQ